jgi:hypothetical protein
MSLWYVRRSIRPKTLFHVTKYWNLKSQYEAILVYVYHSFPQPCQANRMWPSLSNRYLQTIHDHLATRFEIMLSWQNKKSLNDFWCFVEQSRQIWTHSVLLLTVCQLDRVASISSLSSTKSYFIKYLISYVECSAVDKTPLNKTWVNRLCSDLGLLPR